MPIRRWSSIAEWSLASLASVTFIPPLSAMTTCSRASSSQRHSSKPSAASPCPPLTSIEHDNIHLLWVQYTADTKTNLGSNAETPSWSTNCSLPYAHLCCEWDTPLRWLPSLFECFTPHSSLKDKERLCISSRWLSPHSGVSFWHNFNKWNLITESLVIP